MSKFEIKDRYNLEDYRALIHFLRGPEGCPWDREQTHESIRRNLLEEAYETAYAIDTGDLENLREELGDLMMQVLLHADMEEARGTFDLDDVADGACKKLVFRHPHVFGTVNAEDTEAVLRTWDAQKKTEKGQKTVTDTMRSVPENLPALWRAEKIQKKSANAGFAWPEPGAALREVSEKSAALAADIDAQNADTIIDGLGEILFAAVNAARLANVDPEAALHRCCEKFLTRFDGVESAAAAQGKQISDISAEELKSLLDAACKQENMP